MPEYLSPGVYIEEIPRGPRPIEGVATSIAGFVGGAERGPEAVRLIGSQTEFERWYGAAVPDLSFMPDAVTGFFANGGRNCFVTRVVPDGSDFAQLPLPGGGVQLAAIGRGAWGNRMFIKVEDATRDVLPPAAPQLVKVSLAYYRDMPPLPLVDPTVAANITDPNRREPAVLETFDNVSVVAGDLNEIVATINRSSHLVRATWIAGQPRARPQTGGGFAQLVAGDDGDGALDDLATEFQGGTDVLVQPLAPPGFDPQAALFGRGWGLRGLEAVDEVAILVAADDVKLRLLRDEVINQARRLKDRFAVTAWSPNLDPPDPQNIEIPSTTSYAGFYYPWIVIADPRTNSPRAVPPTGHVAGIMAATDNDRGVWKAPANVEVVGAQDLLQPVPRSVQDVLNPRGVNCLRDFRSDGNGIRLWGARTMSDDQQWRYINVRRLFMFIEESIEESTQWVVFEINSDDTWRNVRLSIEGFLNTLWRNGALLGLTPEEAYFVRCDRTTMTEDDILGGRLVCYVGVAPVRPAEFVIFRISQKTADATQ